MKRKPVTGAFVVVLAVVVSTLAMPRAQAQTHTVTISVEGSGKGEVTGPGIDCSNRSSTANDCTEQFFTGGNPVFNASPSKRAKFVGWGGDFAACTERACQIFGVNRDYFATAKFKKIRRR